MFWKRSQNVLKRFTKRSEKIHKKFWKDSQKNLKAFEKRSQSKRFQNLLNQNIHKRFLQTVHYILSFGFTSWLYPFWTVYLPVKYQHLSRNCSQKIKVCFVGFLERQINISNYWIELRSWDKIDFLQVLCVHF
jgi:hypothetical protein